MTYTIIYAWCKQVAPGSSDDNYDRCYNYACYLIGLEKFKEAESQLQRSEGKLSLRLSNQILVIFQICPKVCMPVETGYTNWYSKFQVYKLCGSWDIYIHKCVIFVWRICYFCIPNILLTYDVVCIWFLIGQSRSVIVKGKNWYVYWWWLTGGSK